MKLVYVVVFTITLSTLFAQNVEFSPLSRFGIGDLSRSTNSIINQLGKQSSAFASEDVFNMDNPASLGFLKLTDAELGFDAKYKVISFEKGNSLKDWSGNLNHIGIGVPFRNTINEVLDRKTYNYAMGMSLVLKPYSKLGYNFQLKDSSIEFGNKIRNVNARGGLSQLSLGYGFRKKNLALGLGLDYIFGSFKYDQYLYFDDIAYADNSLLKDNINSNGFGFGISTIYKQVLNRKQIAIEKTIKEKRIQYGLVVNLPINMNTKYNALHTSTSLFEANANNLYAIDTVKYVENQKESTKLPLKVNAGILYDHQGKYGISLNYGIEVWENAKLHSIQKGSLKNAMNIGIGYWVRPDRTIYGNLFQRSQYRFGANYGTDYRNINSITASTFSISAGMGIPFTFQRQNTLINFGLEYGQLDFSPVLNEKYIKLNLGFTINDNEWFLKRRYD